MRRDLMFAKTNAWNWLVALASVRNLASALLAVFLVVVAMPALAQSDVKVSNGSNPDSVSHPSCGGMFQGKLQPPCASSYAHYEGYPQAAAPAVPAGYNSPAFLDLGAKGWYACPLGTDRSGFGVNTDLACQHKNDAIKDVFDFATFRGRLCAEGTFFDVGGGGQCWSCPRGYHRSAAPIGDSNACAADNITGPPTRATALGTTACQAGEIYDMAIAGAQDISAGGGCWVCKDGYDRTDATIRGDHACRKPGGFDYKRAIKLGNMDCPGEQVFDPLNITPSQLAEMKKDGRASASAGPGAGSCWTCPPGKSRSWFPVTHIQACMGSSMEWYSAPYSEPGLFRIRGAEAAALDLLTNHPDYIEEAIAALAEATKAPLATVRQQAWDQIAQSPGNSSILKSVLLTQLLASLEDPKADTPALRLLRAGFTDYIRGRRTYIAQDALKAYNAWVEADAMQLAALGSKATAADIGRISPDFIQISTTAFMANTAIAAAATTALHVSLSSSRVFGKIFPSIANRATMTSRMAKLLGKEAFDNAIEKGVSRATAKIMEEAAEKAALAVSKRAAAGVLSEVTALASVGPQIVLFLAIEAISGLIEHVIDQASVLPHLQGALAEAQRNPDLTRIYQAEDGVEFLATFWASGTSAGTVPNDASSFALVATKALLALKTASLPTKVTGTDAAQTPIGPITILNWQMRIQNSSDSLCMTSGAGNQGSVAMTMPCDKAEEWMQREKEQLIRLSSRPDMCMGLNPRTGGSPGIYPCDPKAREQMWTLAANGNIQSALNNLCIDSTGRQGMSLGTGYCKNKSEIWRPFGDAPAQAANQNTAVQTAPDKMVLLQNSVNNLCVGFDNATPPRLVGKTCDTAAVMAYTAKLELRPANGGNGCASMVSAAGTPNILASFGPVTLYPCDGSKAQQWDYLSNIGKFHNKEYNACLSGPAQAGAPLSLGICNKDEATWTMMDKAAPSISTAVAAPKAAAAQQMRFQSWADGSCIGLGTGNPAAVISVPCDRGETWAFGQDQMLQSTSRPGMCLNGDSRANGTPSLAACNQNKNQLWALTSVGNIQNALGPCLAGANQMGGMLGQGACKQPNEVWGVAK